MKMNDNYLLIATPKLQNDSPFAFVQAVAYIVVKTNTNASSTGTGTLGNCEVNFNSYGTCTKQFADILQLFQHSIY